MKRDYVDLKGEKLFPVHFQLLGIILLFAGLLLLLFYPLFAIVPSVLGALILTGYKGVEFNKSNRGYREYNSFLFMRFGEWKNYNTVEKIFINSSRVSQKVYTMITEGTTVKNIVYNAYLKLSDDTKLHLSNKKDKKMLQKKLTSLSDFFQIEISDNTV